jgi:hypothetical protein
MSNWRDQILREFVPNVARLTLVADPDGLLVEEGVLAAIHARGFELIPFEDPIAFRYAYESKFRSRWDRGEQTDLVVVLRSEASELNTLPYDLLQAGRQLSFNLGEIFPHLSYPIVAALDRDHLDSLYEAQKRYTPGVLGDNATKEFILRHVFKIAPEVIRKPSDLLRVLLRRHYRGQRIPQIIDKRLVLILRQHKPFIDWPLEAIISDREAFFTFLQERWPIFLDRTINQPTSESHEHRQAFGFELPGPLDLPFDHDDVRVYIDNLFLEGHLDAVFHEKAALFSKTWKAVGVKTDAHSNRLHRVDRLITSIAASIPDKDKRHLDWFHFARKWAELSALMLEPEAALPESTHKKFKELWQKADAQFLLWLNNRYSRLINLPPVPPVMLHHIPRFLARHIGNAKDHKVALIVVDGLSLDQWIVIRKKMVEQRPNYRLRENVVLAWIPTLTSVSRQAAFSGKPPLYFPTSIHSTNKESALWNQFWIDQGLTQQEIAYQKGLGDGPLDSIQKILEHPKVRVLGLVVDKVDKIMHGMELGAAGMHNQVRQWADQQFMANLIDLLLDNNFRVHLTSDHGNIEACGSGRPAEGAVADLRGERVRIYPNSSLRRQVKDKFPEAIKWPARGLPEDFLPLLASGPTAFVSKGKKTVCHGGASLEELMVPLVRIDKRKV